MIKADLMKSFKKSFIVLLLSLCVVLSLSQYKVAAMRLIPDPGSSIPSGIKNALASCDQGSESPAFQYWVSGTSSSADVVVTVAEGTTSVPLVVNWAGAVCKPNHAVSNTSGLITTTQSNISGLPANPSINWGASRKYDFVQGTYRLSKSNITLNAPPGGFKTSYDYKFEIYMKRINQFVNSSGNTTQYSCVGGASNVSNLNDFGRCTDITLSLTMRINVIKVAGELSVSGVCNRNPGGVGLKITPNFPTLNNRTNVNIRVNNGSWRSVKNKTEYWYDLSDSYADGANHNFTVELASYGYFPGTTKTIRLNCPAPVPKYTINKKVHPAPSISADDSYFFGSESINSNANDTVYFVFQINNTGNTNSRVVFYDQLPSGIEYISGTIQYKRNGVIKGPPLQGALGAINSSGLLWGAVRDTIPGDEIKVLVKAKIHSDVSVDNLTNTACVVVDDNKNGLISSNETKKWCDTARVNILDPQPRPILSVLNGDITVGSSPTSDPTMYNRFGCDSSSGTGSNVDGSVDGTAKGSNTNLGIFATGRINDFFSNNPPSPSLSTNIHSLKFYNNPSSGGYPSICRPNPTSSADVASTTNSVNLSDALRAAGNSLARTVKYQPSSGILTIGGGTVQGGPSKAIFVDGDVYIPNNIELASSYSNKNQAPSLTIIATGDIRIAPEVDKLEGLYISNGTFNTCTNINNSLSIKNSSGGQACYKQLNVYGAIMAKTVKFRRTYGGLDANLIKDGKSTREAFAETITFAPELIFNAPPLGVAKTIEKMGYKELPPVL